MPLFYFHLVDDEEGPDGKGVYLHSLAAAQAHAKQLVLFTAADKAKADGKLMLEQRIDIKDENGNVLDSVRFTDVVAVY